MKLYHYSIKKFDILKTLELQRKITEEEREKALHNMIQYQLPGMYFEHISFFFEEVPLDIIASCFNNEHFFWKSGNKLWEYTVESNKIGAFKYELVEHPKKVDLYYDDKLDYPEYEKRLLDLKKQEGLIGSKNSELNSVVNKLKGSTRKYYKLLKTRPNFDSLKETYAGTVPHLMIYPEKKFINVESCKQVIVK